MTVKELVTKSSNMRFADIVTIKKEDKIIDSTDVYNLLFSNMLVAEKEVSKFYTQALTGYHIIWIK